MSFDYFRSCDDHLDLQYRSERVSILEKSGIKIRWPLILEYKIPTIRLSDFSVR